MRVPNLTFRSFPRYGLRSEECPVQITLLLYSVLRIRIYIGKVKKQVASFASGSAHAFLNQQEGVRLLS